MTHPKIVGLSDKAFRLWVWGLSYSQQHLTDGRIPAVAIPSRINRATPDLITARLWETAVTGFQVHDYLDWNDSRSLVDSRKAESKRRKAGWEERRRQDYRTRSEHVRNTSTERVPNRIVRTDNQTKPNQTKPNHRSTEEDPPPSSRSKRPIFSGQRFVVHEWQLDDLMRMLGSQADDFDLHEWFFTLDAQVLQSKEVIPQRDGGAWLQARTLAEAQRRGLELASSQTAPTNKRIAGLIKGGEAFLKMGER